MSRNDAAPIGNTCPAINDIIDEIESSIDACKETRSQLERTIKAIELIREANETLRAWGNEEHERADLAEGERDEALEKIKELEQEIFELKTEN